jgi:DNA-binding NtrC family response regulator
MNNSSMHIKKKAKILIVDDEELICWSLKQSFEKGEGYIVSCAYTGDDALQKLSENQYDVVITDLNLPDVKNYEIVKEIRNIATSTPVIVISAYLSENVLDDVTRQGAIKCINKPFEIDYIMDEVKEAIKSDIQGSN